MSAAHKLFPHEHVHTSGFTAAPAVRPVSSPAPKKKGKLGGALAMGSIWMLVMFLCFSLVQKNASVRAETADMARMKEEIAKLEQQNLALEGQIANQVSLPEVEKWARSHGMQPPTGVVQTLTGKPEALATRQSPSAQPSQPQAVKESTPSFWESLLARFTGSASQAAGARQ